MRTPRNRLRRVGPRGTAAAARHRPVPAPAPAPASPGWLAATLVLVLTAGPAAAQEAGKARDVSNLGAVMSAFALVIVVVIVSFMSPRRAHDD